MTYYLYTKSTRLITKQNFHCKFFGSNCDWRERQIANSKVSSNNALVVMSLLSVSVKSLDELEKETFSLWLSSHPLFFPSSLFCLFVLSFLLYFNFTCCVFLCENATSVRVL